MNKYAIIIQATRQFRWYNEAESLILKASAVGADFWDKFWLFTALQKRDLETNLGQIFQTYHIEYLQNTSCIPIGHVSSVLPQKFSMRKMC